MKNVRKKINFDLAECDIQQLPRSDELEAEVLGCVLNRPSNFEKVYKYLKPDGMFSSPESQKLWEQMKSWVEKGTEPSIDTAREFYTATGDRDMAAYSGSCFATATGDAYLVNRCLRLNEYWITRAVYILGFYLNQGARAQEKDILDLLGEASDGINMILSHISQLKEKGLSDAAEQLYDELKQIKNSPQGLIGLPSSIPALNNVIKGYRKGGLIVIGGSTGEGKSTFAFQESLHLALQKIPVGIISLEMMSQEIIQVMISSITGLESSEIMSANLTEDQMDAFFAAGRFLNSLPLYIQDTPGLRIGQIKATARMWHKRYGIQMLVVDHIHLVRTDTDDSSAEQRYTDIANQLKELAKELNIPVLCLAQLARKDKSQRKTMHGVEDVKYAGGIEQAADIVLLIFRPEMHDIEKDLHGKSTAGYAKIIVGKLRLLPRSHVTCHFTGTRFVDMDEWERGYYQAPTYVKWLTA
jgi:replicative DNA helicase